MYLPRLVSTVGADLIWALTGSPPEPISDPLNLPRAIWKFRQQRENFSEILMFSKHTFRSV